MTMRLEGATREVRKIGPIRSPKAPKMMSAVPATNGILLLNANVSSRDGNPPQRLMLFDREFS